MALSSAIAFGQSITIQGKVVDANGANITGSTQFRVQILSPDTNHCVLYDESRTLDLTTSNGLFSLNVGSTGGTRVAPTTYTLEQVLSNRGTLGVDGSYCSPTQSGTVNYIPGASDNRKLTIQFQTGSSAWETIPEMDLNPVPFAVDARNLGGFPATQVVRVSGGVAPLLSPADVTSLNALLDGSSTKFVSNASGKGAQLPSFSSDPSGAPAGSVWFDSVSNTLKYRDNSGVVALSAAVPGGPITSVSGTGGLTGSGSSGAVSLSMASISGVAGSYGSGTTVPVLTVDGYGRITIAGSTPITGAAPTGSAGGDLSGTFPSPTVAKIRGASVSSSAPAPGQFYRFDDKGTPATTDDEWVPVSIHAADLKDNASGSLFPGACAANQVFHFNGLTGGYDCGNIAGITSAQLATSATLPAGGTFRSVTVDTKGLVTAGTNPTTIDDYAISDAIKNGGAVPKISSGSDSPSLPATAIEGELFIATNSKKIYRYTSSAWMEIASAAGSGTLTDVLAGGGLNRTALGSTVTLALPPIAAVNNATKVNTDAFGRVTSAGTLAATDIPDLDYAKITTGKPTSVATSGLTDAMTNLSNAKGLAVGTGALPARTAATLNTFYINSSTGSISYDDGSAWKSIAAAPGGFTGSLAGDVSGTQSTTSVDRIKGTGVSYTSLTSGDFLRYNGTNWVNSILAAADLPIVPTAKGGTGLSTLGTADQFLSVKSDLSGMEYKSITAGTGVTITPSVGGLQISAAGSGGTVTTVTATTPIVVANGSTAPAISLARATASADGYLEKSDFANFAGKLDASASLAGDVTGTPSAAVVSRLKGNPVNNTGLATGHLLRFDGANWNGSSLSLSDLVNSTSGSAVASAACAPGRTMYYDVTTKELKCQDLNLSGTISGILSIANGGTGAATLDGAGIVDKTSAQTISGTKTFTSAITAALRITGGTPGSGKVLTSDASGNATWAASANSSQWTTTGPSIYYAGNVGIGTSGPSTVKLEVIGEIKVGNAGTACNSFSEGALRYNATSKKMEYCNSSIWSNLSSGTNASVTIGSSSPSISKSGPVTYLITYGSGADTATITLSSANITIGGSAPAGCSVSSVTGSGSTRTVSITGCSGTGDITISLAADTAKSTTGDSAAAAGPSASATIDNTGPTPPATVTLGSVPNNLSNTPTITYPAASDVGGSTVASYQVKIIKTSDSSLVRDWATHTSGSDVGSLTLASSTQYSALVRAVDALGNIGAATSAVNWTTIATLYTFSSHTFTPCSQTGRLGPTLSMCQTAYAAATWTANTSFYNMTTQGIQEWTVPGTGSYKITVAGARGGYPYDDSSRFGKGVILSGLFSFTQGEVIKILVGQRGSNSSGSQALNSSGGGGSFVFRQVTDAQPLIVGGGGGGGSNGTTFQAVMDGSFSGSGNYGYPTGSAGGTGGNGGNGSGYTYAAGAGAGWVNNGAGGHSSCGYAVSGGLSPRNGGLGGNGGNDQLVTQYQGGFGGGGGGTGACNSSEAGAGGGYSGGSTGVGCCSGQGGGGGSYNSGTSGTNVGANTGDGYVLIEKQ